MWYIWECLRRISSHSMTYHTILPELGKGLVVLSCVVTPGMHSTVTPRLQDEMQVFHFRWTRRDVWK
jgi:hypothetical protein